MKAWQQEYGERYRTARAAGYEPTRKLKPLEPITLACEVCGAPIIRHRQPSKGRAMRCDPCRNKRVKPIQTLSVPCSDCGELIDLITRRIKGVVRCAPCFENHMAPIWEAQGKGEPKPYPCVDCGTTVYRNHQPSQTYGTTRCQLCDRKARSSRQLVRSRASKPPRSRIRFCEVCGMLIRLGVKGTAKWCLDCRPEQHRRLARENAKRPEKKLSRLEVGRAWYHHKMRTDPAYRARYLERKRLSGGRERVPTVAMLLETQRGKCANPFCRRKLAADGATEIDHIIPVSRGGLDDLSNLQALCTPCNRAKHDKRYGDWLEEQRLQQEAKGA